MTKDTAILWVVLVVTSQVMGNAPMAAENPEKAICQVCATHGETTPEKVAATTTLDGVVYYFCAESCRDAFNSDPAAYVPPSLPRPAPAFQVETPDGRRTSLADLAGKVVLVDFWATWCKPCVKLMPRLQRLHDTHGSSGLAIMGISIDEGDDRLERVSKHLEKHRITYPVYLDTSPTPAWSLFHVKAVPAMFLIDRDGQIVAQWAGAVDEAELSRELTRLLATEPAAAAADRSTR